MAEQEGAAYALGVSMGILSYHASAGHVDSTLQGFTSVDAAAHRLLNAGIEVPAAGEFNIGPNEVYDVNSVAHKFYTDCTSNPSGLSSDDLANEARNSVAPVVVNMRGNSQGVIQSASAVAGQAYGLGVWISLAEGQATAGDDARSIVFDCLVNAIPPAQSLGLDTAPLATIHEVVAQGADLSGVYQDITYWRGNYQGQLDSAVHVVPLSIPPSLPTQANWRYCHKCAGLIFAGYGLAGCFGGQTHDWSGSWDYLLVHGEPFNPGQHQWKYCNKCHVLFYAGFGGGGACPVGGGHDGSGSWDYALATGGTGQNDWRYCKTCQGLFFAGFGNGACKNGGHHDGSGSWDYILSS